jgi:hypothetical protein
LNFDFRIKNEIQNCKIGTVWGVLLGGERVNEGDKDERIWLMGFIYIHEI